MGVYGGEGEGGGGCGDSDSCPLVGCVIRRHACWRGCGPGAGYPGVEGNGGGDGGGDSRVDAEFSLTLLPGTAAAAVADPAAADPAAGRCIGTASGGDHDSDSLPETGSSASSPTNPLNSASSPTNPLNSASSPRYSLNLLFLHPPRTLSSSEPLSSRMIIRRTFTLRPTPPTPSRWVCFCCFWGSLLSRGGMSFWMRSIVSHRSSDTSCRSSESREAASLVSPQAASTLSPQAASTLAPFPTAVDASPGLLTAPPGDATSLVLSKCENHPQSRSECSAMSKRKSTAGRGGCCWKSVMRGWWWVFRSIKLEGIIISKATWKPSHSRGGRKIPPGVWFRCLPTIYLKGNLLAILSHDLD